MSQKRRTVADEPFFLVRTLAAEFASGQATERHAHDWGQLIYASAGVLTVWTEAGSWVAPPHWAIWVPAGVRHSIRFSGDCALRTLYLRPGLVAELPKDCAAITVSPLLRELVVRTTTVGMLDEREAGHRALALLIVSECRRSPTPPFDLPAPSSEAARRAAKLLQSEWSASPADIARQVGLSVRTLERRFRAETGLTLGHWRRHARLLQALQLLASGQPTKVVAQAAGYQTASAFVAAFRTNFGATPGRYFHTP